MIVGYEFCRDVRVVVFPSYYLNNCVIKGRLSLVTGPVRYAIPNPREKSSLLPKS